MRDNTSVFGKRFFAQIGLALCIVACAAGVGAAIGKFAADKHNSQPILISIGGEFVPQPFDWDAE